MINTVGCKTIINFFQDVSISYENSTEKNLSSALKIASCFALVAALYVGFRYVSSLVGRTSQSDSSERKEISEKSINEQLEELFKSSEKAQKCFFINNLRVGVVFNPKGEKVKIGLRYVDKHLIVASLQPIPDAVWEIIENQAPANQRTSSINLHGQNGYTFKRLGFD